jgi:hypothetical protein
MNKILIQVVFFSFFFSCTNRLEKQKNHLTSAEKIVVDIESNTVVPDSLISKIELIPLKFMKESAINEISKIENYKERFYILDQAQRDIKIFDNKGNFINKISRIGKGPGEYIMLRDFTIIENKNLLALTAQEKNSILLYNLNGYYSSEIKANRQEMILDNIQYWNKQLFHFCPNPKTREGNIDQLHITDLNLKIRSSQFPSDQRSNSVLYFNFFSLNKNGLNLHIPYCNTIYEYENGDFYAKYNLDYKKYNLPDNVNKLLNAEPQNDNDIWKLNSALSNYSLTNKIICLNDYILIEYKYKYQRHCMLVCMRTKKIYRINSTLSGIRLNNIVGGIKNSNTLLVSLDPVSVSDSYNSGYLTNSKIKQLVMDNINDDVTLNNPWILQIHLK